MHLKNANVLFQLALMDIMDKNATEYAMLHALVVTTLTDCVILAVIQDGRGTSVNNVRGDIIAYRIS